MRRHFGIARLRSRSIRPHHRSKLQAHQQQSFSLVYQSFPSSGIRLAPGNSNLFRRPKMNIVSRSPRRRRDGCSECKRKKVRVSTSHRIVEKPCADPNSPVRSRTPCLFPVHPLSQTMQIRVQNSSSPRALPSRNQPAPNPRPKDPRNRAPAPL